MVVPAQVEACLPSHGGGRTERNIWSKSRREPRGSVHLARVNRQLFDWIYLSRFATRQQLTVALRGEHREDRFISRTLRKLYDHSYVSMIRAHPWAPAIYCVTARCLKGRRAVVSLFGDDSRIVTLPSHVSGHELEHSLALTWLRVFADVSSRVRGWNARFLDHQDLTGLSASLPLIPDGAVVLDRGRAQEGKRLFLIEYQRFESARKTTPGKLAGYQELLPEFERLLGAQRGWLLLVLERPESWVKQLASDLERAGVVGTFFCGASRRVLGIRPDGLWTEPVFYLPGEAGPCSIFKWKEGSGVVYEDARQD